MSPFALAWPLLPHGNLDHLATAVHATDTTILQRDPQQSSNPALPAVFILATMGLGGHNLDTNALLSQHEKVSIQQASVAVASVSVAACLVSLYWFLLMRRNFRRTLVMLLLLADLFKSSWFMIFPAVSLRVGGIKSNTVFCDVGGFFLQAGIESCDAAILLMSIHMSLQVFRPNSARLGPDGLYRYRHFVYVIWIILPCTMAGLGFVRSGPGSFLSQGAFCTLPIRPFWYRLALSWVPRYLIWIYIFFTALRIYLHVGNGFTVFARMVDSASRTHPSTIGGTENKRLSTLMPGVRRAASYVSENVTAPFSRHRDSRRPSTATNDKDSDDSKSAQNSPRKSTFRSDRDSLLPETTLQLMTSHDQRLRQESHATNASSNVVDYGAAQIVQGSRTGEPLVNIISTADCTANSRRRAIQRQTRLLFIYPCVYLIFMAIPFAQHCFTYSDYYAQHPVYPISMLGPLCYSVMGTADCLVFCWREKPWRNIPGSSGTFLGSFCFWRLIGPWAERSPTPSSKEFRMAAQALREDDVQICPKDRLSIQADVENQLQSPAATRRRSMSERPGFDAVDYFSHQRPGSSSSTKQKFFKTIKVVRPATKRVFSGQSDQAALAAERAAERLALERAAHARRSSHLQNRSEEEGGRREWFDREEWLDVDDVGEDGEEGEEEEEHAEREKGPGEKEVARTEREDTGKDQEETHHEENEKR